MEHILNQIVTKVEHKGRAVYSNWFTAINQLVLQKMQYVITCMSAAQC